MHDGFTFSQERFSSNIISLVEYYLPYTLGTEVSCIAIIVGVSVQREGGSNVAIIRSTD